MTMTTPNTIATITEHQHEDVKQYWTRGACGYWQQHDDISTAITDAREQDNCCPCGHIVVAEMTNGKFICAAS